MDGRAAHLEDLLTRALTALTGGAPEEGVALLAEAEATVARWSGQEVSSELSAAALPGLSLLARRCEDAARAGHDEAGRQLGASAGAVRAAAAYGRDRREAP